jgi:hypothetical protein
VSGQAWGLRFKYDCSIVQSASQFTVLRQRAASTVSDVDVPVRIGLQTPSGATVALRYTENLPITPIFINGVESENGNLPNVQAYFEIGTSGPRVDPLQPGSYKYNGSHPGFEADEGNDSLVFEYAVWQYRHDPLNTYNESSRPFNSTLGPSVEGMGSPIVRADNGTYVLNSTYFALNGDALRSESTNKTTDAKDPFGFATMLRGSSTGELIYAAPPIGVRCVTSSDVGTAELNGVTSTFDNFQRSSPDANITLGFSGALRFGLTAKAILAERLYEHYLSGNLPGLRPSTNEDYQRYESFIDTGPLLRSINLAHALDASNLMYDISSAFRAEWTDTGLTSSRVGKILSVASLIPGYEVGNFVLALFCLWAVQCAGLGLWYGFRRRPSDRLDGYTMLRKGADMAGELKENDEFMSGKPFHDGKTLAELPGNVLGAK